MANNMTHILLKASDANAGHYEIIWQPERRDAWHLSRRLLRRILMHTLAILLEMLNTAMLRSNSLASSSKETRTSGHLHTAGHLDR